MGNTNHVLGWTLSGLLCLSSSDAAIACAFHGYTPDPTLVDVLLGTEQAVIARLSLTNSSRFVPVETLLGHPVSDLSAPVSANARKRLTSSSSSTILLARDGSYGPWVEVAVLDRGYRSVISHVIQRQSAWLYGGDKERLGFFAARLNDPNPDVRRLALRELDRAPYADLRSLRLPVVQRLAQDLKAGDNDLKPIRILLAGLSQDAKFARPLYAELDRAIQNDTPYLGAYATALIELQGQGAVQEILDRYLTSETVAATVRDKLLQAFALHYKSAPRATRRFIAREVAQLSRISPAFGEAATRQFGGQRGWRSASPSSKDESGNGSAAGQAAGATNR